MSLSAALSIGARSCAPAGASPQSAGKALKPANQMSEVFMSKVQATGVRDLSLSPFPLRSRTDAPSYAWHAYYPIGTPAGLEFEPLRVEQLLLCAHQQFAKRPALHYFNTTWTYAELVARAEQTAANLYDLGIRPGDRVLMVLPNCPEFVVAWFALHWIGVEVVPANPLLSGKDLAHLARKTSARAIFGLDVRLGPVAEMTRLYPVPFLFVTGLASHLPLHFRLAYLFQRHRRRPKSGAISSATHVYDFSVLSGVGPTSLRKPLLNDSDLPALLQPTGGTTGTPKVAILTHQNLQANVAQLHVWCGLRAGSEVVLSVLPFFHGFGSTVAMLSPIAGGATMLLHARFDPRRVWKSMHRWKPTVAPMVPFMFSALCEEMRKRGKDLDGLRLCMSGAAALRPELAVEFHRRTGVSILEGYGLSEASPVTHVNPSIDKPELGTIGVPLPDTAARIVDAHGGETELPPGEVGELIIRGPQVMAGYLDHPEETAVALRDGWLYTGDLAWMDARGYFTIVERKKDMIISGGLNIYPSEVEAVLSAHPAVEQCAVVGAPDPKYGERLVAHIVRVAGASVSPAELEAHCRRELASYKVPRSIRLCNELPTNFLGKVKRVALRAHEAHAPLQGAHGRFSRPPSDPKHTRGRKEHA